MARGLSMRGKQKRHSDCGTTWYGHWWQWVAKEWEELVLSPCRQPGFPREWLVSEEQEKTAGWGGLWRQRKNHHLDLLSPSSSPSFLRPTLPVTLRTHGAFLPQPPARRSLWAFMVQSNRKARDKEGDQALSLLFPPSCSWSQWQTSSRSHIFLRIFFFLVNIHIESPAPIIFFPPDQEEQLLEVYIKAFFSWDTTEPLKAFSGKLSLTWHFLQRLTSHLLAVLSWN